MKRIWEEIRDEDDAQAVKGSLLGTGDTPEENRRFDEAIEFDRQARKDLAELKTIRSRLKLQIAAIDLYIRELEDASSCSDQDSPKTKGDEIPF